MKISKNIWIDETTKSFITFKKKVHSGEDLLLKPCDIFHPLLYFQVFQVYQKH